MNANDSTMGLIARNKTEITADSATSGPSTATSSTEVANAVTVRAAEVEPTPGSVGYSKGKVHGRHHRKPLALPNPIPSKPVRRYPKPSHAELKVAIDKEQKKIRLCYERLGSLSGFYKGRQNIVNTYRPGIEAARYSLNNFKQQYREAVRLQENLMRNIKTLRKQEIAARNRPLPDPRRISGAGKDCAAVLKNIRSVDALESRIKELKHIQATELMNIAEENVLVKQICFLQHRGREFVRVLEGAQEQKAAQSESRNEARRKLERAKATQQLVIGAAVERLQHQRRLLEELWNERQLEIEALEQSCLTVNRRAESGRLAELKGGIQRLREDFGNKMDLWRLNERIHFAQSSIAPGALHQSHHHRGAPAPDLREDLKAIFNVSVQGLEQVDGNNVVMSPSLPPTQRRFFHPPVLYRALTDRLWGAE